jgi:hypothetical protein
MALALGWSELCGLGLAVQTHQTLILGHDCEKIYSDLSQHSNHDQLRRAEVPI